MLKLMFTLISTAVIKKVREAEEVENIRWKIESLVTCVPRTLQVEKAFTITGRPTVEARGSVVHSATNHSAKMVI